MQSVRAGPSRPQKGVRSVSVQLAEEGFDALLVDEEEACAADVAWRHQPLQSAVAVASGGEDLLFVLRTGCLRFGVVRQGGIGAQVPVAAECVVRRPGQVETRGLGRIEDVAAEGGAFGIAVPVVGDNHAAVRVGGRFGIGVDDVALDARVLHTSGDVDAGREHALSGGFGADAVADADVVAHDAVLVAQAVVAFLARVAHQHQSAIVVVTVVVLDDGVRAVVVAVVGLCVPGSLVSADVVELDGRIVAAPGPEACGGFGHGQHVGTVIQ